ncbi:MAG: hypothetical protein IKL10_03970 [Clostridia bacterium]|nr:hypothetical protein [Clostridia bacterium]
MFDLKMRARLLLRGKIIRLWFLSVFPVFFIILGVLCFLPPFMSIFYDAKEMFPYLSEKTAVLMLSFLGIMSVFMFFFSAVGKLYFKAKLFFLQDENSPKPDSFYKFSQGLRFIYCHFTVAFYKLVWAVLFFSPSGITFLIMYSTFTLNGSMIKSIFITLVTLFVISFLIACVFYLSITGRYYLCDYLMFISPLQSVKNVISTSAEKTRGRLTELLYKRLCIIPYRFLSVFIVTAPYSRVFTKCLKAVICEKLYSEEKISLKLSSAVFFINRKSVFG